MSSRNKRVIWQQSALNWMEYFVEYVQILEWTVISLSCYKDVTNVRGISCSFYCSLPPNGIACDLFDACTVICSQLGGCLILKWKVKIVLFSVLVSWLTPYVDEVTADNRNSSTNNKIPCILQALVIKANTGRELINDLETLRLADSVGMEVLCIVLSEFDTLT